VGLNLSQIGEFVFVLLSVANQQGLLAENVYMLLMGALRAVAAGTAGTAAGIGGSAGTAALPRCSCLMAAPLLLVDDADKVVAGAIPVRIAGPACSPRPMLWHDLTLVLSAGITAFTLLLTPFLLQISDRIIPRPKGHPNGPSAGDLEMAGLIAGDGDGTPSVSLA
jgi:Kef-type K+ transport system membrane component KefB